MVVDGTEEEHAGQGLKRRQMINKGTGREEEDVTAYALHVLCSSHSYGRWQETLGGQLVWEMVNLSCAYCVTSTSLTRSRALLRGHDGPVERRASIQKGVLLKYSCSPIRLSYSTTSIPPSPNQLLSMKIACLTIFLSILALVNAAVAGDAAGAPQLGPRGQHQTLVVPTYPADGRRRVKLYEAGVFIGAIEEVTHGKEKYTVYGPGGDVVDMSRYEDASGIHIRSGPSEPILIRYTKLIQQYGLRFLVSRLSGCSSSSV